MDIHSLADIVGTALLALCGALFRGIRTDLHDLKDEVAEQGKDIASIKTGCKGAGIIL